MGIENLSTAELLFDRQECYNDLAVLAIARQDGAGANPVGVNVEVRIRKNLQQLEVIRKECYQRGFDPAQFDQVQKHFVTGGES